MSSSPPGEARELTGRKRERVGRTKVGEGVLEPIHQLNEVGVHGFVIVVKELVVAVVVVVLQEFAGVL